MGLREYRKKRDFARTPEPEPREERSASGRAFVVQKHAARRLHYDLRLELDGVLLSWAVPKGPSLDPKERRLAVRTEDHPVEYGTFEGVIPKGEYGGGTVLLWDRGAWEPTEDPRAGLKKGHLRFALHGQKLRGRWTLVRTRGRAGADSDDKEQWLLIKRSDDEARLGDADRLVKRETESVLSGRGMEAIASDPDRVWRSGEGESAIPDPSTLRGAKERAMPRTIRPELATLVEEPPEGDDWIHELKYDGYRIAARLERGRAQLFTRKQLDWTARAPSLARALAELPVRSAWLDGEMVVLDAQGRSRFGALQQALRPGKERAVRYVAFDLLYLDGWDLRPARLIDRKALLRELLARTGALEGRIRYGDHVVGSGAAFFEHVCELGVEGMVSKRASRPYVEKRTKEWLKLKCLGRAELLVGGFTEPSGSRIGLGALLLGERKGGQLRYVGRVGTGFSGALLKKLRAELAKTELDRAPFVNPPRGPRARGVHWVAPEMVVEVAFAERTDDGCLRHPKLLGVREDKPAREVVRERPASIMKKRASSPSGVRLTSPEKVLWPEVGLTKRDLAEHYARVAARMLPHVAERPLALVRCPEGVSGQCFFQKHAIQGMPPDLHPIDVAEKDETEQHTMVKDEAGLVSLAQIGVLEVHTWGSHRRTIERPDQLVIDLDPGPGVPWARTIEAAHEVRARLRELGLTSFAKTTGGKGLHVVVPIARRTSWDDAKGFAHAIAKDLARRAPADYTATMAKSKRRGKIFVDYLRNGRGATAVCVYSPRKHATATVSMPVAWRDLTAKLVSDELTIRTIPAFLKRRDPWEGFFDVKQSITKAMWSALDRPAR